MAVGTLADAVAKKAYTSSQANDFLTAYTSMSQGMKDQLDKLLKTETLDSNDTEAVRKMIGAFDLILAEIRPLRAFVKSGDESDAKAYEKARVKALKGIQSLLNIADEEE